VASRYPPTPDAIKRKLDSLRPPGASERPSAPVVLEQDEVTGVINLALERIAQAHARIMRDSRDHALALAAPIASGAR
jgi:hypothetical protein